jgi:uncharacterized protein
MTTKQHPNTKSLTNTLQSYFKGKAEVIAVYLFGSYVRGLEGPASDIDIGILLNTRDQAFATIKRTQYLTELGRMLRKDIHPVILNTAGEALMKQVFKKGKCIIVNNHPKHAHFRMTMFSRIAAFGYYRRQMQSGFIRKVSQVTTVG